MVQFLRKVSDSEQTKRAALRKIRTALNVILSNCTKLRNFSHRLYGDSIPSRKLKTGNYGVLYCRNRVVFWLVFAFGHAPQTFHGEASKKVWETGISGRPGMAPSKLFHGRMPAFGTQTDVKFPDSL